MPAAAIVRATVAEITTALTNPVAIPV